jgi:NAD-dependent DNA ligase
MASFAYYFLNESLITDALYDEIYQWLEKNIEQIDHVHKHLIEKDMFSIGSAYYLREYPKIIQVSTHNLLDNLRLTAAPQPRDLWKRKTCPTQ